MPLPVFFIMQFYQVLIILLPSLFVGWVAGWYFGHGKGRDEGFVAAIQLLQEENVAEYNDGGFRDYEFD